MHNRIRSQINYLEIELAHHGGNDNGRLPVTYEDFIEYGNATINGKGGILRRKSYQRASAHRCG
jgi:hypothetical protein